jgi:hypothetical protein
MGIRAAFLFSAALLASAQDSAILRTEKTPFDFARLIEAQTSLDWPPLWRQLRTADPIPDYLPRCVPDDDGPCSTELITVLEPSQVIVLVSTQTGADHYFRFLQQSDGWSFAGYYGSLKNLTQHGILRVGGRPFLKVSEKGTLGSDAYLASEEWFDLTFPSLKPVFTFPVEGDVNRFAFGIGRRITGVAIPGRTGEISLALRIEFTFSGAPVGVENFTATYERRPSDGQFEIKSAQVVGTKSRIDSRLFEEFADVSSNLSNEAMLVFALPGLKEIASSKDLSARDAALKKALKQMLSSLDDTPEKRALLSLLNRR